MFLSHTNKVIFNFLDSRMYINNTSVDITALLIYVSIYIQVSSLFSHIYANILQQK